ncbi:MAG: response regulator [Acidobacteriota bacterium]
MPPVRVLIADDHTLVREGVSALLNLYEDLQVVGQAEDGLRAVEEASRLHPDVILMDIAKPGLGGLEATIEIRKTDPRVKILVLSQYDNKEYIKRFLKAGAAGYVLKKAMGEELVRAIRAVARGESYLYPAIASRVIEDYLEASSRAETDDPYEFLTDREKQVLKLIAEGQTHKEAASTLGISTRTVIAHQTHICEKLDVHSRADLIKFAISKGIIQLD